MDIIFFPQQNVDTKIQGCWSGLVVYRSAVGKLELLLYERKP